MIIWLIFPTGNRNLLLSAHPLLWVSRWILIRTIEPVAITGIRSYLFPLEQWNVFNDFSRISSFRVKAADFIFNLAVNIDIVILVIGFGEDVTNKIGFADLSCSPYNQRLSAFAIILLYQFLCRISLHKINLRMISSSPAYHFMHLLSSYYRNYLHVYRCLCSN